MNSFHLLVHTRLYELGAEWEAAAAKFHESYVALGNKVITDDEFVSLSVLPVATICNQICFLQDGLKESGATGPALLMVLEKDTIKYSVISLLLDLLSDSHKDKRFKIACLRCVTSVTKACGSPTTISKIFPGVSTAVFKICVGDFKQGKELTALAIESWTQITSIAMSDDALSCFSEEQVAEVKAKVRVMAENVFSFKFGPPLLDSYCVRLALVRSAVLLLESCCTGLKECTELFLDTIVLYNNIESDPSSSSISTKEEGPNGGNEVVRITEDAIEKMSQKILEKKSKKEGSTSESDVLAYLSSLEENAENASQPEEFGTENDFSFAEDRLYSLLSSLPRLNLSTLNDEKKLDTVRLVNGYIKLLSGSLSSLVPVLLDRIALTLISLLEFDVALPSDAGAKAGNVTIWKRPLQQQQSGGIGLSFSGARTSFLSATRYPRHEFRFFGDMRIALELKKMCSLLAGLSGDDNATALVSSFLELYADTKNHKVKNQIIYILIGTVEGIRQELLTETLVSALVENVLEATLENFTTCNSSPFYDTLFSLVSELFGKLYMRASLDTLSAMLPKVLYPLLELLG